MTASLVRAFVLAAGMALLSPYALAQNARCESKPLSHSQMKVCVSPEGAPRGAQVQITFKNAATGRAFAGSAAGKGGGESWCASVPELLQGFDLPATGVHWLAKQKRLICNFGDTDQAGFEQVNAPPRRRQN